jgi:hypothetical protein
MKFRRTRLTAKGNKFFADLLSMAAVNLALSGALSLSTHSAQVYEPVTRLSASMPALILTARLR